MIDSLERLKLGLRFPVVLLLGLPLAYLVKIDRVFVRVRGVIEFAALAIDWYVNRRIRHVVDALINFIHLA